MSTSYQSCHIPAHALSNWLKHPRSTKKLPSSSNKDKHPDEAEGRGGGSGNLLPWTPRFTPSGGIKVKCCYYFHQNLNHPKKMTRLPMRLREGEGWGTGGSTRHLLPWTPRIKVKCCYYFHQNSNHPMRIWTTLCGAIKLKCLRRKAYTYWQWAHLMIFKP